jgi:voltage-gated potassium channel Kch
MPIYRVIEPSSGQHHLYEWRRRALRTLGLLLLALAGCAMGLVVLDNSDAALGEKLFTGLWNAANLVTTLGDFTGFDKRQKLFMMATMLVFLMIGGYAVSRLTGILSSDAVLALRENRAMERELERLVDHVIVIGFGPLGQLVARRLRDAGNAVVVVDRGESLAGQASEAGYLVVQGDAGADDIALDRAGVERARALVVTTDDPDRKLSITLMAHARNPKLKIAVTGANSQRGALLQRAGASEVVVAEELIAGALVDRLGK